jgi:hypothetical protein
MSVKVNKFKLEGRGTYGIKVSGQETRPKDGFMVVVDIDMHFKIPLPTEIFATVQRLKKYMLDLCGYWHPSFEEFIKQGRIVDQPLEGDRLKMYDHLTRLMESAEVTGVVRKDAFFIITGKVTNALGATVGVSSPLTGPSSGYDRWDFINRGCRACLDEVEKFVNDRRLRLMQAKQYALWGEKDPEKIDQYESMTDEELLEVQIRNLESRGAIVMLPEDFKASDEAPDPGAVAVVKAATAVPVEKETIDPADIISGEDLSAAAVQEGVTADFAAGDPDGDDDLINDGMPIDDLPLEEVTDV